MDSKIGRLCITGALFLGMIGHVAGYDFTPTQNPQEVTNDFSLDSGNNTFSIPTGYLSTFTGVISGPTDGVLVKTDDGILALNGANTYIGGTLLQGGTIRLGSDTALGVWPNSAVNANVQGLLTVSGTGTVQVLENRTITNRFITANDSSLLTFEIASGKTLTLQNVNNAGTTANSYGGVVSTAALGTEPIFTGGGNLVVQGNRSSFGGGLSSTGNTGTVGFDFTELASAQFLNNTAFAGNGGAVYVTATGTNTVHLEFGDHLKFSGNTATTSGTSGDGGAVFAYSSYGTTLRFGNDVTFSNNTANRYGGALYVFSTQPGTTADLFLGTHTLFDSNVSKAPAAALAGGGAIYSTHNATVSGNTLFRNNAAMSYGGAILMKGREAGTLLLDTSAGDIGFTGNYMSATNINAPSTTGMANSVYLDTLTTMQIQGTGNVFFDDPIASGNKTGNKMVLDGAFSGFVQLQGNSAVQNNFAVQINGGTLRFATGAQLAGATAGSFTVGTNGTLAGSGTIGFGTNTVSGTVTPDSLIYEMKSFDTATNSFTGTSTVAGALIGTLTFTGATKFDDAEILVDISGTNYDKIVVNNAVTFGTTKNNVITLNNAEIGGVYNVITSNQALGGNSAQYFSVAGNIENLTGFGRYTATVQNASVSGTNNVVQVVIGTTADNTTLYWTGVDSDVWVSDELTGPQNWTDVPGGTPSETRFMNGDRVIFNTTSTTNNRFSVGDNATTVTVADMLVTGGGDYTINGNITATTADTTVNEPTGKLVKEGTGTLTLNGMNNFQGGVDITGGTVKAETVDSVRGGPVTMANNSTLQFDNSTNGTLGSDITGAGNLLKTAAGTLTLTGTNDYTGSTNVRAGTLIGNIASGTDLTVSSGATYQAGTADRIVSSLNGAGTVNMNDQSLTVSSGDFTAGSIVDADTITKSGSGIFAIGQTAAGNLVLDEGTLNIAEDKSVVLTGTATIADGTTLGIGVGDGNGNPSLSAAGTVTIENNTIINITGYHGVTGTDMLLIHSDVGITGGDELTTVYTIGGQVVTDVVTETQFVNGIVVRKENENKDLVVTTGGLVWNNTGTSNDAHGYFFIDDGATATLAELLADNTDPDATVGGRFGWDGITLTKTGDGELVLNYANTYTGDTLVTAGSLVARNVQALGTTGKADISDGATLVLNYTDTNPFSNEITGTGNITVQNDVLINRANSGFTGATTVVDGATLNMGNVAAVGDGAIANAGSLELGFDGNFANDLSGSGELNVNGDIVVSQANTGFTGSTAISSGKSLTMENAQAVGTSSIDNTGTLNLEFGGTFGNALSGAGNLVVDGDVVVSRSNSGFTGNTTITSGKSLTLQNVSGIGNTATQTVTNDGSIVFDLSSGGNFAQKITGTGSLTKNGAGTLVLSNTNTDTSFYSGSTTVNAGTLISDLATNTQVTPCGTDLIVAAGATYQSRTREQWVRNLSGAGIVDMNAYDNSGLKKLTVCSGDFSGGEIRSVDTFTKSNAAGTFTVGNVDAAVFNLAGGTLNIAAGKQVEVDDIATIFNGTTLGIALDKTTSVPALTAGNVSIGTGTTLNVTGYNASMGEIVLIDAGSDIADEFGTYTVNGVDQTTTVSLADYVNTSPIVQRNKADMSQIVISTGGLVWNNTAPGTAHGMFNVTGIATVGDDLDDNVTDGPGFGWNGQTLTKTGTGTLTLTGDNTYTGGTVINGGKVVGTHGNAFGTGTITTGDGTIVEFNIGGPGDEFVDNDITGTGDFYKTGHGTLIHTGDSTYTGQTTVYGGTFVGNLVPADPVNLPCGAPLEVRSGATYQTYDGDQSISYLTGTGTVNMNAYDGTGDKNLSVCAGEFADGHLENVTTLTKKSAGILYVGTATVGNLELAEGVLIIDQTQTFTVEGNTHIADGTFLSVGALPALYTNTLNIDSGAILDVCACSSRGVVIKSATNINGTFSQVYVAGSVVDDVIDIDQFVNNIGVEYLTTVDAEGPGVKITAGELVWFNSVTKTPSDAHGTFNVGSTFTVSQKLVDRDPNDFTTNGWEWDGKTLTKTGAGTLNLLNGENSYSGGTNIEAGTVVVKAEGALGSGDVQNDGTLQYSLPGNGEMANDHSGTGSFVKNGTGTLTVTGLNTYIGGTRVNSGTLISNLAAPTDTLPCGTTLLVADGATYSPFDTDQFVSDLNGSGTVDMNAFDLTVCEGDFSGGEITGVGTLTKISGNGFPTALVVGDVDGENLDLKSGSLEIAEGKAVALTGDAVIHASTGLKVTASAAPALTATGSVSIDHATTLNVTGYNPSMGTVVLIDAGSDISNDFNIYMLNGTNQTNTVTLANYRNTSALIQRDADDLSRIIVSTGGLVWNNTAPGTAHGTFKIDSGTVTISDPLIDKPNDGRFYQEPIGTNTWDGKTLTKTGTGNLTLTGDNTYTGGTDIEQGTVTAANENALGTGAVDIDTDGTLALDYDGTLNNTVRGTGQIEIDGNVNIVKSNGGFSGNTVVTTGTTTLQRADGLGNSAIALGDGTTLFFNTASSGTSQNTISGTGNLVKGGAGTLTLANDLGTAGTTTVRGGTLVANLTPSSLALPCGAALTVNAGATYQAKDREQYVSVLSGTGTVNMLGIDGVTKYDLTVCSGDFTGGTFENLNNVTKSSTNELRTDGFDAVNFTLEAGTFILNSGQVVTLTGTADIGAGTILDIGAHRAFNVADAVTIDPTATLNITGYSGSGTVVLIHSDTGINGDFGTYTINGTRFIDQKPSLDQYYVVGGVMNTGSEIVITDSYLAWYGPEDGTAHGTFRIDSGTVTISELLRNNNTDPDKWLTDENGVPLWDGVTLTKTGNGTLKLGNENTYHGNTVIYGGSVVATGENSLGDSGSSGIVELMDNDVSLVLDYTADSLFDKMVKGGGTIRKTDGNTLTVTSHLSEMTGVFRQDAGTVNFRPVDNLFTGSYDQRGGRVFFSEDDTTISGSASFEGTIQIDRLLNVGGTVDFGAGAIVNINAGLSLNVGGAIVIDDSAVMNIDNYTRGEVLLVHSDTGISGNFGTYTINDREISEQKPSLDVYYVHGGISKTDFDIKIVDGYLAWYSSHEKSAHGHFYVESGSDAVAEDLTDNNASSTWMVDGDGNPLWDGKTLTKTGSGTLTLTGANDYTGPTIVSEGTLIGNIASGTDLTVTENAVYRSGNADRIIGILDGEGTVDMQDYGLTVGGGEFCAGTLSNVGRFTKNSADELVIGSFDATGFDLAEGILSLCHNGRIDVTGTAEIGDGTTFNIGAVASLNTTDTITIGDGATLNITGYSGEGEVILVQSDTEIVGDFDNYMVNGVAFEAQIPSLDRYFILDGIEKSATTIRITDGHLAWYDPNEKSSHGHFYIDHGSVTISTVLIDNPASDTWLTDANDDPLWDGKTLTKTGTGTLVLDAVNDYTGNTVITAGTAVATNENSLGRIGNGNVLVSGGANLEIRYSADGTFSKTVQGEGTIRKTDGFTTTVTSNLTGMTGNFVQAAGTIDWQTGRFGGSFTQASGRLEANGIMNIGGNAVFQGEVVPGAALTVDGNVTLAGADLYVNLYLNENQPVATADFISGREITIDGGTLHVSDKGVVSDYLRGSVTFVVLKSTDGITGDFAAVTGITSIFHETHGIVGDDYVIELSLKEIPFDPFAPNHNTRQVVTTIDTGMDDPDLGPLVDVLINMDTDNDLAHAIDTLRGTEIAADGLTLALWSPWRPVFNRLYDDPCTKNACQPCDSARSTKNNVRNAWFEGYYRTEDVSTDTNARSYEGRRSGMIVGIDTQLNRRLTVGAMFGYGEPRLNSRYGRIEADDYTMALYGKVCVTKNWFVNGFLGYGSQEFDYRRHDFAGAYRARYDGDAMYAGIELVRPMQWRRGAVLMPIFGVDFQKSWTDAFTERGTGYVQSIRKADLGQTALRFGLNGKFHRGERFDLNTRLQYIRQVGGNTHGTVESTFAMAPNSRVMNLWGVDQGRDRMNIGLGGGFHFGSRKSSTVFADYDFDYGKNYRSHTGQIGFATRW